ncbi:integrase [Xenorhabdus sp. 12]|uniref:Integrase n=1 Tax=Xenorhabdus santafensis TaxID=2582833 RepID=A0ABU4SA70_9GAMM|nr:tyrosine-type recombinase/integrase [Xenorhabdus sp. 12]MDX7987689.1 integrase [Xenorhabdus sp. 12]
MTIKKLEDGRYEVDIRPTGRNGKRIRRKFSKKHEAVAFERHIAANHTSEEWLSKPKDIRPLSELAALWWKYHGINNSHGHHRQNELNRVIRHMNDPVPFQITNTSLTYYCNERLASGVKASTINRELAQLSGMFTVLAKAGLFLDVNPLAGFSWLREENAEMSYLTRTEIDDLLSTLTGDNHLIAILCLSTGARWGEALKLKAEHIIHNRVTFVKTKNSKLRTVPISSETNEFLVSGKSGFLFPNVEYTEFRKILKEVKPNLPHGQSTHVMRHTFATHFMINGGNILTLQRILGHSKIEQTMKYAHFAPDFLNDAIRLNPITYRGGN